MSVIQLLCNNGSDDLFFHILDYLRVVPSSLPPSLLTQQQQQQHDYQYENQRHENQQQQHQHQHQRQDKTIANEGSQQQHLALFLQLQNLISLGYTNRFFYNLLFDDGNNLLLDGNDNRTNHRTTSTSKTTTTTQLFDTLFHPNYGKAYWKNTHALKELVLVNKIVLPELGADGLTKTTTTTTTMTAAAAATNNNKSTTFPSLKILSEENEIDSLGFYNPRLMTRLRQRRQRQQQQQDEDEDEVEDNEEEDANNNPCAGYFGFELLPTNGEVAVWGDFSGLSFYSNVSSFVPTPSCEGTDVGNGGVGKSNSNTDDNSSSNNHVSNNNNNNKPYSTMLASYRLQVMAVLVHDDRYMFLGFANGDIDCLQLPAPTSTKKNNTNHNMHDTFGNKRKASSSSSSSQKNKGANDKEAVEEEEEEEVYPYISGSTNQHQNEITTLASINSKHLASGSILSSNILIHWNALLDGNLNRGGKLSSSLLHYHVESIMSIASCVSSPPLNEIGLTVYADTSIAIASSDGTVFFSYCNFTEEEEREEEEEGGGGAEGNDDTAVVTTNGRNSPVREPWMQRTVHGHEDPYEEDEIRMARWIDAEEEGYHDYSDDDFEGEEERTDVNGRIATWPVRLPPSAEGQISFLSYLDGQLVIGTNMGYLVVMNKDLNGDGVKFYNRDFSCLDDGVYDNNNNNNSSSSESASSQGVVEDAKLIGGGTILLTAGGCHGDIRFYEWDTGIPLCRWMIHPGRTIVTTRGGGSNKLRYHPPPMVVKSSVVSIRVCHERSSIIAMCQDGYIRECSLKELMVSSRVARKERREEEEREQQKKEKKKKVTLLGGNLVRRKRRRRS